MRLAVGKEQALEPEVRFWLEERPDAVWLVAKDCRDGSSQNVAVLKLDEGGAIYIEFRRLFAFHLCQALGTSRGDTIKCDIEPAREPARDSQ